MKGYGKFVIAISALLVLYILAEMNRPKAVSWEITLSKEDKNPYGAFVLYHLLGGFFPSAEILSTRLPVYNTLQGASDSPSAYLLIDPELNVSKAERKAILSYVAAGNYAFISSVDPGYLLMDTLQISTERRFNLGAGDSMRINLVNPALRFSKSLGFRPMTLDTYFKKVDTSRSLSLGDNQLGDINFISMEFGKGKVFFHALPLCFSNSFLLTGSHAAYVAKVLSYLPKDIGKIYWDEYYKLGPEGSTNPLRFALGNTWLRWSLRIALLALFTVLFFEGKRRQRIIPIIKPLRNTTLDFVRTVGSVYYHQRNNKNLAQKKISYFTEFLRSKFYLNTNPLNEEFILGMSAKTGVEEDAVRKLVLLIKKAQAQPVVEDEVLLELNREIDVYYQRFA